jgi:SOS response regulatory protein OraA/RecX
MEEYDRAKRAAASLVSSRMYTCREVEERLRRKKIRRDVAEQVVSDFVAAGILNDAEYAMAYTQDAVRLGFKGVYRIQQELYAKGVARSFADRACEEFKGEISPYFKRIISAFICVFSLITRDFASRYLTFLIIMYITIHRGG